MRTPIYTERKNNSAKNPSKSFKKKQINKKAKTMQKNCKWEGMENLKLLLLIAYNRRAIKSMVNYDEEGNVYKVRGFSTAGLEYFGSLKNREIDVIRIHFYSILPKAKNEDSMSIFSESVMSFNPTKRSANDDVQGYFNMKKKLVTKIIMDLDGRDDIPSADFKKYERNKAQIPTLEEEVLLTEK